MQFFHESQNECERMKQDFQVEDVTYTDMKMVLGIGNSSESSSIEWRLQDLWVHPESVSLRVQDTHVCNVLGCQGLCFIHVRRPDFALSWMCECSIVVHLVLCGSSFHISLFPTVATGTTGAARSSARDLEKLESFNRQKHCDYLHLSNIYYFSVHFIGQLMNYMGLY